jgi:hypothetical protein
MKEHFVNYNQALALKELGFNEPCMSSKDMHNGQGLIQIPLFQQAFRWFRENHSINGIVSYYGKGQWNIEILDYKGNELIQIEDNTFWSYEEAESACIDKLIELCLYK